MDPMGGVRELRVGFCEEITCLQAHYGQFEAHFSRNFKEPNDKDCSSY